MGPSKKLIYLPNNTTLQASERTMLPFTQLLDKAREADILPCLKQPLASISKFSNKGITTVFHPGEEGVTVHKPGTITIITNKPSVLQGCKAKGLWSVKMEEQDPKREMINSVYSIPLTKGKIKFLHTAVGYSVEDTWIKAINAGNYLTWPGLSVKAVRHHFPKFDETQKGHMKKQRQNVRLTRIKI
jgi:hypothetical protein